MPAHTFNAKYLQNGVRIYFESPFFHAQEGAGRFHTNGTEAIREPIQVPLLLYFIPSFNFFILRALRSRRIIALARRSGLLIGFSKYCACLACATTPDCCTLRVKRRKTFSSDSFESLRVTSIISAYNTLTDKIMQTVFVITPCKWFVFYNDTVPETQTCWRFCAIRCDFNTILCNSLKIAKFLLV